MIDVSNFEVISEDAHGAPVRCSHCAQGAEHVVVLPISERPELDARVAASDGEPLWVGLCAHCVLAMARALAAAQGKLP